MWPITEQEVSVLANQGARSEGTGSSSGWRKMRREELAVRGSVYGREFCFGEDRKPYRCEIGYCCGDSECCTYYYELWWFWLAWTLIILAGCCCACRHRRVKLRHQHELRQREISLMAYQGFPPPATALEPWPNCKLPTYDEVTQDPPTPPPPYCEILDEAHLDGGNPQIPVANFTHSEQFHQEEPSAEAQASTVQHTQPQHDNVEPENVSALERRRHVTGDSGIVLCDEKLACMSEREGEAALSRGGYISVDTSASTA